MSWIIQELSERCGAASRTAIWIVRGGGMDSVQFIVNGDAHIAIFTPAKRFYDAPLGKGFFADHPPFTNLRGLAMIPQNDRLILGLGPKLDCKTFADIRENKPKLKIALGPKNRDSQIGYVGHRYLEARGVPIQDIISWGGEVVSANRPQECLLPCHDESRGFNAVLQEALTTPWWGDLVDGSRSFIPIPAESEALEKLSDGGGPLPAHTLPAGWWKNLKEDLPVIDFCDFLVPCRDDLPDDVCLPADLDHGQNQRGA